MALLLGIWLAAAAANAGTVPPMDALPWQDLALTIEEDRGFSSDHATLCLVRVVNHGRGTWSGHEITFEALAVRDGRIAARQRGRFGLTLGPHETLETRVAFVGRFDRLEVVPAPAGAGPRRGKRGSGKRGRSSVRRHRR